VGAERVAESLQSARIRGDAASGGSVVGVPCGVIASPLMALAGAVSRSPQSLPRTISWRLAGGSEALRWSQTPTVKSQKVAVPKLGPDLVRRTRSGSDSRARHAADGKNAGWMMVGGTRPAWRRRSLFSNDRCQRIGSGEDQHYLSRCLSVPELHRGRLLPAQQEGRRVRCQHEGRAPDTMLLPSHSLEARRANPPAPSTSPSPPPHHSPAP
jgi:hypothetical protein